MHSIRTILCLLFFSFAVSIPFSSYGQLISVKGYVTDSLSSDSIAYATVYIKGTPYGTVTDIDGFFEFEVPASGDTILISNLGYLTKKIPVSGITAGKTLSIELVPDAYTDVIYILPGENPAFRILREVVDHKKQNDKRRLSGYEYQSFSRTELYINNISDELRQKKIMREVAGVLDSMKSITDENGNPMIPVLLSETVSDYYYRTSPNASKEIINGIKVSGVGMDDGSLLSQVLGSTFQDYNFYENYLNVLQKDFISPITDNWNLFYEYELMDSMYIDSIWCYEITFAPKEPKDLALYGKMWIADSTFALKKIEAKISNEANLNYIDNVSFRQTMSQTEEGAWLPEQTSITLDIQDLGKQFPSLIARYHSTIKDPVVNQPRPSSFFDQRIQVMEDAQNKGAGYWDVVNRDSTIAADPQIYKMIDTLRSLPSIKSYIEFVDIAINGYKTVGKIDIGPYITSYAYNNIEGSRIRVGFRTNTDFSRKLVLKGFLAYGTRDTRFKYGASVNYILSRKSWTEAGAYFKYDIDQVALPSERLVNNNLFLALSKWGTLRGPYFSRQVGVFLEKDINKYIKPKVMFRHCWFDPLYNFASYDPETIGSSNPYLVQQFETTELILQSKFSYDEFFLQNGNERISLGSKKWPVVTVQYTLGLKGVLNGDYQYNKLLVTIDHSVRVGILGRSNYVLSGGKIFNTVPYPLLENHIGNETIFFTTAAFNLMNFFEFSSDQYASLRYKHDFEGFFTNRIPVVRKLKWRMFFTSNILMGSMTSSNKALISPVTIEGEPTPVISTLNPYKPYVELGYGVDNIFKVLRVDFVHRVTYLDSPDIRKFGVKISFHITL